MIRIHIVENKRQLSQITITGHANYEEYGKDIICAAVSATYLCTVNACLSLKNNSLEVLEENDKQIVKVLEKDETIQKLLWNMINCLNSLQEQYPKNIKLDKEEK